MTGQKLMDKTESGEAHVEEESNAWQKHVMVGLWILLAVFLVVTGVLLYGKSRGWFAGHPPATPPWPVGWP